MSAEMSQSLSSVTQTLTLERNEVGVIGQQTRKLTQALSLQFSLLTEWGLDGVLLQVVKSDHLLWKARLAEALLEGKPINEAELKNPTQCRLGLWYHSAGKARYGELETFRALETPHARVHALGREIDQLIRQGATEPALIKLTQLEEHCVQLFALLDALNQEIQQF